MRTDLLACDLVYCLFQLDGKCRAGESRRAACKYAKLPDEPADAPTSSPWHRVEDELPDLLQFVVVCNDEGKCVVAQYVGYQTDSMTPWRIVYTMYDTDIYDENECGPVRYWMPIEPPKEER